MIRTKEALHSTNTYTFFSNYTWHADAIMYFVNYKKLSYYKMA